MSRLSPGLGAFVDYLHLLDESEEELAESHLGDRAAVSVMTIHQAKVSNECHEAGLPPVRTWVLSGTIHEVGASTMLHVGMDLSRTRLDVCVMDQ